MASLKTMMRLSCSSAIYLTLLNLTVRVQSYSIPFTSSSSSSSSSSRGSLFAGRPAGRTTFGNLDRRDSTKLMYESSSDLPTPDTWSALATTEKWISTTLSGMADTHSRKKMSYVCDPGDDVEVVVASIFRRLREARETADAHAEVEKERLSQRNSRDDRPRLFRETQVVVLPSCENLDYPVFDGLVTAINKARRNARDYVTDVSIEKRNDYEDDDDGEEWSTSVSLAHMHPGFKDESIDAVDDPKYKEYLEKKQTARQSPYPTLMIESRAMPPMQMPEETQPPPQETGTPVADEDESPVSFDDVSKLEALFTKSVALTDEDSTENDSDDSFTGIEDVASITPANLSQKWLTNNDDLFDPTTSDFVVSGAKHVDEAYEFVFSMIAKMQALVKDSDANEVDKVRSYIVMPQFLSSSATSLDKFSKETRTILDAMMAPGVTKSPLRISTYHPEDVDKDRRSPFPIFVLQRE